MSDLTETAISHLTDKQHWNNC